MGPWSVDDDFVDVFLASQGVIDAANEPRTRVELEMPALQLKKTVMETNPSFGDVEGQY